VTSAATRDMSRGCHTTTCPEHFVRGVSIKELMRRTGLARNTIRVALRSPEPPTFRCPERPSKLDPFKEEICELLRGDARMPGVRVRELIEPLGYDGGRTIVDDYLREVRPLFVKARTHQRTVYRPGEICQWVLWETSAPVPVGHGQTRRAWVVVACLGYSRAGAGALIFSKEAPDVLWGIGRCLWSLGALPQLMVWDREGCLHAGGGRPTDVYAGFCGRLPVDDVLTGTLANRRARRLNLSELDLLLGHGWLSRPQGPRRSPPTSHRTSDRTQLDAWFAKANARTHKTLRARPIDRLAEESAVMRALPDREPDVDRRWVTRVPPDPHVRCDTNDYSLDPNLVRGEAGRGRLLGRRSLQDRQRHARSPGRRSAAADACRHPDLVGACG
jgi:hypothetical protein